MDHLMAAVQSISLEADRVSEETKSLYSRLVEIRQSQWKIDDSEMPNTFVIPEAKPTKKGSNAIAIMAVSFVVNSAHCSIGYKGPLLRDRPKSTYGLK